MTPTPNVFDRPSRWRYDEDRSYHGYKTAEYVSHLVVELSEFGPTERKTPYEIRQLRSDIGDFGCGYNGTGTSATADTILRDALNFDPFDQLEPEEWNEQFSDIREDFCEDVAAHFTREFIIRRGAVLRWVRGWAAERDVRDLPPAIADLPPISRHEYQRRPDAVREAQRRQRQR